jgi:hypothetical protein
MSKIATFQQIKNLDQRRIIAKS